MRLICGCILLASGTIASCNQPTSDAPPSVNTAAKQDEGLASLSARIRNDYSNFKLSETETERRKSSAFSDCMEASGGVTVEMRDCSSAEYERQDNALNAEYKRAMASLPAEATQNMLRMQQRAWLKSRNSSCDAKARKESGTLSLAIADGCYLDEVIRRTAWLESIGQSKRDETVPAKRIASGEVTTNWLQGTWAGAEHNPTANPRAGCDTDVTVTFNSNGTFEDGGSSGKFKTDGRTILYYDRIAADPAADEADNGESLADMRTTVSRVDALTLREEGATGENVETEQLEFRGH